MIGVLKSYLFLIIVVFVAIVQVIFVEYGGKALSCSTEGLSQTQWLICLGFAFGGLVVNLLLKLLPDPSFSVIHSPPDIFINRLSNSASIRE